MPNIQHNLETVRRNMARAAARGNRDSSSITLIAVTKTATLTQIRELMACGVTHFAENRLEPAREKIHAFAGTSAIWHMIGNIQRRKAKDTVALFDYIDTVDRVELALALQQHAEQQGKIAPVLLEVNVPDDLGKHGFAAADVPRLLDQLQSMQNLYIRGLMTMAPLDAPESKLRAHFRTMKNIATVRNLAALSMGMSNDYEIAIEEGATEIRIGTALVG